MSVLVIIVLVALAIVIWMFRSARRIDVFQAEVRDYIQRRYPAITIVKAQGFGFKLKVEYDYYLLILRDLYRLVKQQPEKRDLLLENFLADFLLDVSGKTAEIVAGGLYSVQDGQGTYAVVKILVHEEPVMHLQFYHNVFENRPRAQDIELDRLDVVEAADDADISHTAVTEELFFSWLPVLIMEQAVAAEELTGYRRWKQDDSAQPFGYLYQTQHKHRSWQRLS